ncbi:MAG: family 16 glycosylhydrolase [Lachnospiraceae bacterium]|nr:family 16 glycosylhydrolase [Lachnospiraceae bacterium]
MKKRVFALIAVFFLIFSCIPCTGADAAAGIRLSKTKVSLEQGEELVLKLKGGGSKTKVKWSVSKKSIASIKNSGKARCRVIAKKAGTTYVRAKYDGKIYRCRVTVNQRTDIPEEITFNGRKYTLAFADEFDSLDMNNWAYCPEMERQDAGGVWRRSCSSVVDGNLMITCDIADDGTPISGGIRSVKEHERTYGLYHIRFMAEKADGLWYAFWLLSDNMEEPVAGNGATDGAELDIIELVPNPNELCMSVHWDGYGPDLKSYCELTHVGEDFYGRYHDLWYLWDERGYRLYMDGTDSAALIFDVAGNEHGDGTCAVPCDLIISAEYGKWGGDIDKTQLPAHFYVDHVRIYEKAGE